MIKFNHRATSFAKSRSNRNGSEVAVGKRRARTACPPLTPDTAEDVANAIVDKLELIDDHYELDAFTSEASQQQLLDDLTSAFERGAFRKLELTIRDDDGDELGSAVWVIVDGRIDHASSDPIELPQVVKFTLKLDVDLAMKDDEQLSPSWDRGKGVDDPGAVLLRIYNTGSRNFAFADAVDGGERDVFCHFAEADSRVKFRIGDLVVARLKQTDRGVQARDIRAYSA